MISTFTIPQISVYNYGLLFYVTRYAKVAAFSSLDDLAVESILGATITLTRYLSYSTLPCLTEPFIILTIPHIFLLMSFSSLFLLALTRSSLPHQFGGHLLPDLFFGSLALKHHLCVLNLSKI